MIRASVTVCLLAGAISGCSKPNPLFLDTAGGVSEGGTQVDTDGGSAGSTGATPTTGVGPTTSEPTTGVDPVTSDPGTTSPMTTAGPTSGTTGGQDFFCEPDPMSGCCAVEIPVEADNFLSEARDGTGQPGCPLVANPMGFESLLCGDWSFGKATELGIFNDFEGQGQLEANKHYTHLALRFPMVDGLLLFNSVAIPWDVVKDVQLHVPAKVRWDIFSAFGFGVHGLPVDQTWVEGVGNGGNVPVPCKDANTSFFCRACGGAPGQACAMDWTDFDPVQQFKGTLGTTMVADENLLVFEGVEPEWLSSSPGGLVLVAFSSTSGNLGYDYVPSGAIIVKARESGQSSRLHLTLCQP